jgi:hypothetical protein
VFRPSTGRWSLNKNNNEVLEACTIDLCQGPFGGSGDRAVAGDWSGNGKAKTGVYRPSTGRWYVDYNGNGRFDGCVVDRCWGPFEVSTDKAVVGDWVGDGKTKMGVYRPSTGFWTLDANGNGVWNPGVDLVRGPFVVATDRPVAGAW